MKKLVKPAYLSWKKFLNKLSRKERLFAFADYLETLTWHKRPYTRVNSKKKFNISTVTFNCHSPACIGGHAAYMSGNDALDYEIGAEWLGIPPRYDDLMFFPNLGPEGYKKVSPKVAARAIRNYANGKRSIKAVWAGVKK